MNKAQQFKTSGVNMVMKFYAEASTHDNFAYIFTDIRTNKGKLCADKLLPKYIRLMTVAVPEWRVVHNSFHEANETAKLYNEKLKQAGL